MNRIDLQGRIAVVTGGARGIGLACARRMLESGPRVVLWDRGEAALASVAAAFHAHDRIKVVAVDVSDSASVDAAATATRDDTGRVDILVNNAGITGPNKPTWDYEPAEWRRVIDVDLTGPYLCARALLPGMIANRYGRIVNVASVAGKDGNPNAPAYSAAKAGLIGLTKSMGKETCGNRRARQLRHAGRRQDRHIQSDDGAAHRVHALEDPDGPFRRDGRDRRPGGVALLRRLQLQHRRRVRYYRRPRDLLTEMGGARRALT
jgi:2-dehydro-3-deoxy-L-rhamnonate dehydrogenase (NAD+)